MPRTYVTSDCNGKELFGTFSEKELKKKIKTSQKEFRIEK